MRKILFYSAILSILVFSCKKNNTDNSFNYILTNSIWHDYQIHELNYRTTNNNLQLIRDTTYLVNSSPSLWTYQFKSDYIFIVNSVSNNPQNKTGNWNLTTDNFLTASVQLEVLGTGQLYNVGIYGQVLDFDNSHFNVSNYSVTNFYYNGVPSKDSTIRITTYKN
jgi:hypothetical protein